MNTPHLVAFFKGTKSDFDTLGPALACSLMGQAADMRNHVSPYATVDCEACNGTGYTLVPNGPDDIEKEVCQNCGGSGRVVANQ